MTVVVTAQMSAAVVTGIRDQTVKGIYRALWPTKRQRGVERVGNVKFTLRFLGYLLAPPLFNGGLSI